ncbi:MAG: SurA N-terminal domain-containing protein, partial [Dongiaceae bacterium]
MIILAAVGLANPLRAQDSLRIAAVVNDDVISQFDLAVRTRMVIVSSRLEDTPEIRRRVTPQVLRGLIDERLKMQEAKRLGVVVNKADIETQIAGIAKQNNMTLAEFETVLERNGILRQTLADQVRTEIAWAIVVQRRMRPSIDIGDDEIDEALAQIADNQ